MKLTLHHDAVATSWRSPIGCRFGQFAAAMGALADWRAESLCHWLCCCAVVLRMNLFRRLFYGILRLVFWLVMWLIQSVLLVGMSVIFGVFTVYATVTAEVFGWFLQPAQIIPIKCVCVAVIIVLTLLSIILLPIMVFTEMVAEFVHDWRHLLNDPDPDLGSRDGRWELVASTRSCNNGYKSKQFYASTICDSSVPDDPFWPDHISVIYMVEIRRRSMMWQEVVVWRVSMVNGGQERVSSFNTFWGWDFPFTRIYAVGNVQTFQNGGIVFVACTDMSVQNFFVFDIRLGKRQAVTLFPGIVRVNKLIAVTCLQRLVNKRGVVDGWKIQILHSETVPFHGGLKRARLCKTIVELRNRVTVISNTGAIFGRYMVNLSDEVFKSVRVSGNIFGVYAMRESTENGPSMLYDSSTQSFVYCRTFEELQQLDTSFKAYSELAGDIDGNDLCPTVLNKKECVRGVIDGMVYRSRLGEDMLMYAAAKSLFRSDPSLRNRLTDEQFRRLTGLQ